MAIYKANIIPIFGQVLNGAVEEVKSHIKTGGVLQ